MDLNRYVNNLDENDVKRKLTTIKNIIGNIKDNLQELVNNPL
jgi:hypothetical protein